MIIYHSANNLYLGGLDTVRCCEMSQVGISREQIFFEILTVRVYNETERRKITPFGHVHELDP